MLGYQLFGIEIILESSRVASLKNTLKVEKKWRTNVEKLMGSIIIKWNWLVCSQWGFWRIQIWLLSERLILERIFLACLPNLEYKFTMFKPFEVSLMVEVIKCTTTLRQLIFNHFVYSQFDYWFGLCIAYYYHDCIFHYSLFIVWEVPLQDLVAWKYLSYLGYLSFVHNCL